jgi:2'-5' RNA ligase
MDYHPVTEVIPPSKPEWPKEFRLAPHAPSLPQQHQAAKDTDHSKGVMVALVPPPKVAEALVQEDGTEPVDSLHITLAYLGETTEMTKAQLRDLPEVVAAWAEAEMPLSATTQGAGTFLKADEDGQHVMWASVAIPGVNLMHERLIHALEKGGYSPRTDHEFTPHLTLSYSKYHVRFLPKIERMTWDVDEVWCVIAGEWENFSLGSS